jgi:hypothetical protein
MEQRWQDSRGRMLFAALGSALPALAFFVIAFQHHNTNWFAAGIAAVFGITAVAWLIRWRRTPKTL